MELDLFYLFIFHLFYFTLDAIRVYELSCVFRTDEQNSATQIASVRVLSVDTSLHSSRAVFDTRHKVIVDNDNVLYRIIYLDYE